MLQQQDHAAEGNVRALSDDGTRSHWAHVLLAVAAVVYGLGAVILMTTHPSATVSGWFAGTVAVVIALGLVGSSVRFPARVPTVHRQQPPEEDLWAEEWEELMQSPVR